MLHKCANPACLVAFRKLSQGKLFLVERESLEGPRLGRARPKGQSFSRFEYYWLCDQCALVMTLSYEKGQGVVAVPRPDLTNKKRPTESVREREVSHNESNRTEQSA